MRRSLILDVTVRFVFDAAMVLSVYLLFAGHNLPGGGFVGGLVAAAAICLRYVAGGMPDVDSVLRVRPWSVMAAGLALSTVAALAPVAVGRTPLDHGSVAWDFDILGKLKLTSSTAFDAGVYLIVVGVVLMVLEALGDDSEGSLADGGG